MAADEAAAFEEDGGAREPVAGGEDDVIEMADLGGPSVVEFVEVEVPQAGVSGAIRVGLFGVDEEPGPEHGDGEVVGGVEHLLEVVVAGFGNVFWALHLINKLISQPRLNLANS